MSNEKHKVQMLIFSATWCGPCRMMAPVIDEIKAEFDAKNSDTSDLEIRKVDIDKEPELAQDMGIRAVPTIVYLVDGVEQKRLTGMQNKIVLVNGLNLVLK